MIRAVTSASNLFRRQLCPGSERLEAGLSDEDTEQSKEGTLLHEYDDNPKLERSVLKPVQRDLLKISQELDEFVLGKVYEKFPATTAPGWVEHRQLELSVTDKGKKVIGGTCDRIFYHEARKLALVIDKKFGFKEVTPASANIQLRCYAVGASEKFEASDVVVAITQPRLSYSYRITMAAYTAADIESSRAEIVSILETARKKESPLVPGELQCRYCRARALCPALREKLGADLALITLGAGTVAKRSADADELVKRCSDDQLDRLLVAIQLADFVKDFARDEGRRRVAEGKLVTWKLGKEGEQRKVADPRRAFALLALNGALAKEDIFDCSSLAIGKLEEKLWEKQNLSWKEAKGILYEILGSVIEVEQRKPSLSRAK